LDHEGDCLPKKNHCFQIESEVVNSFVRARQYVMLVLIGVETVDDEGRGMQYSIKKACIPSDSNGTISTQNSIA